MDKWTEVLTTMRKEKEYEEVRIHAKMELFCGEMLLQNVFKDMSYGGWGFGPVYNIHALGVTGQKY